MTWWCCSADYPNHEPTCKNYEQSESSTQQAPERKKAIPWRCEKTEGCRLHNRHAGECELNQQAEAGDIKWICDSEMESNARAYFLAGGGGHEDGVDGARVVTYAFTGMVQMAAAFAEHELSALKSSTQQAPEPRTDIDAVSRDVVKLMKDYGYVYSFEHNDINHLANQIVRLVRRQS